jgi:hypothetical protein
MATPLASLFHGDINIDEGCSPDLYGYGDLNVYRQAHIGTGRATESTDSSNGTLTVNGGLGVSQQTNLAGKLTAYSNSNLRTTFFDTTWGGVNVSGANGIIANVNSAISMTTDVGDITLYSVTDRVFLQSGEAANDAIRILASNVDGGIDIDTGANSGVNISSGSLGLVGTSVQGPIRLTAINGDGSFIVNAASNNKMLSFRMTNDGGDNEAEYDTGILIDSASKNTNVKSIQMNTSNQTGNIYITNTSTGTHAGQIELLAGSSGLIATTNTNGPIKLTASNAASYFVVNNIDGFLGDNHDLRIAVDGVSDSSLVLESQGTNNIDSIILRNTHNSGSMLIENVTNGSGNITMYTGSGGFNASTWNGGQINLTARGASSSFINKTTNENGQDLVICVQGIYDGTNGILTSATHSNKLILCSSSINAQSIFLSTSGGTYLDSFGAVNIQSSDSSRGIEIGTTATVPVIIGTTLSTTTIKGNLDVKGTTTTYDSTIVQIKDNFVQVNNQPQDLGPIDGGLAIKRYQPAGQGLCASLKGSIVSDVGEYTGNVTSVVPDASTISVTSSGLSTSGDAYAGYWIKVTYYNGDTTSSVENHSDDYCWVRRISSSTSTDTTATFTVYNTAAQTGILNNPVPVEGLDLPNDTNLTTPPTTTNLNARLTFSIYPCHWVLSMWDESNKEYALVCTNSLGDYKNIVEPHHYINLHVNNIKANALTVNSINNLTADVQFTIQLGPNTTPVPLDIENTIPSRSQLGFIYPNYGVFMVLVRPKIATATSPYAIFVIGRRNDATCGQVARLISVKGTNGEMLGMDWLGSSYPRLFYRPAGGSIAVDYTLKFITV